VNQMDQVTRQNAAMVEQATAASHSLTREAEALAGLVRRFQIGDESGRGPSAAPVPRAPARTPKPSAEARAPAVVSAGGYGPEQKDEWGEF
jgi:methyl-accepting chemotaxis protein